MFLSPYLFLRCFRLFVVAFLISQLSSAVAAFETEKNAFNNILHQYNEYMNAIGLPQDMQTAVRGFVSVNWTRTDGLDPHAVLSILPPSLQQV